MDRITSIKGFKRQAYLPRLGKIRLGIVKSTAGGKEYPTEVDYFVCPPEVQAAYDGETKIKKLDIIFPSENINDVIPFCYKRYGGNNRLQCRGDGEFGYTIDPATGELKQIACPCDFLKQKKCAQKGHLMVILPRVSLGGVYQIDTGSTANINRIMDAIVYWQTQVGRVKGLPLTIERVPEKIPNPATGKMNTHYLFRFGTNINIENINKAIEEKEKFLSLDFKIAKPIEDCKLDDTPREDIIDTDPDTIKKTAEFVDEQTGEITEVPEVDNKTEVPEIDTPENLPSEKSLKKFLKLKTAKAMVTDEIYEALWAEAEIAEEKIEEELTDDEIDKLILLITKQVKKNPPVTQYNVCENCGREIQSRKVVEYSKNKFGKIFCYACQKTEGR